MALDVLRFNTFAELPHAAAIARFDELAASARQKAWDKKAELINEEEWHCLRVLDPDSARTIHRDLRERQDEQQHQKQSSPAPTVQLARFKDGEDIDAFFARCKSQAMPVYVVAAIYENTLEAFKTLSARNSALEKRVQELEARASEKQSLEDRVRELETWIRENKSLEYFGVFDGDQRYRRNSAVTFDGALWISRVDSPGVPGTDNSGWTCAVLRGRPGRNGQDHRGNDR